MNKIKKTMDSCFLDAQGTESKFLDIISFNISIGKYEDLKPALNSETSEMVKDENEDYDYWRII